MPNSTLHRTGARVARTRPVSVTVGQHCDDLCQTRAHKYGADLVEWPGWADWDVAGAAAQCLEGQSFTLVAVDDAADEPLGFSRLAGRNDVSCSFASAWGGTHLLVTSRRLRIEPGRHVPLRLGRMQGA